MSLVPVRKQHRNGLTKLHDEMDDLINSFFGGWNAPLFEQGGWPAIDIADNEDSYVVKAKVPGCKADDIDIAVHGNTLTVSGEKRQEEEKQGKGYYHVERYYGSFRREINLPGDTNPDKIEAVCKNGVLSVKIAKTEKAKPMKIKIKEQ